MQESKLIHAVIILIIVNASLLKFVRYLRIRFRLFIVSSMLV